MAGPFGALRDTMLEVANLIAVVGGETTSP